MGQVAKEEAAEPDMDTRQHMRPETCQKVIGRHIKAQTGTASVRELQAKDWERMFGEGWDTTMFAPTKRAVMEAIEKGDTGIPSWAWIAIGIWLIAGYFIYLH